MDRRVVLRHIDEPYDQRRRARSHRLSLARAEQPRAPLAVGLGAAAASVAFYAPGWHRAFSWDASNAVGHCVATPSLLDPFRRQVTFNNQVLFSAVEHVLYTTTGSRDERLLRVPPIAFAAVAIGVLSWAVARRWGALTGAVAAAVVVANPIAATEFREARGYSLLVLASHDGPLLGATSSAWHRLTNVPGIYT